MRIKNVVAAVVLVLGITAGSGCRREELRTGVIRVPQMRDAEQVALVTGALWRVDGVLRERIRVEGDRVWVTYDSMRVAMKNIEHAIAATGLDANDVPVHAEPRAARPSDRR